MSEQPKPEGSLKKQLISLGIIVALVVGGWYLSAVVSEAIFQRGKIKSVDLLSDTDPFTTINSPISLPNFTPPDDWGSFDPSLLDLLSGLPFLSSMFGNFTDVDQFNTVAFRVYERTGGALQDDSLWRYSAFDEYQGNGWARSVDYNFGLDENYDSFAFPNNYEVWLPHGAEQQVGLALPSVFPYPDLNIIGLTESSLVDYTLSVDSQNGSSIVFTQDSAVEGNLTYNLYGNYPSPESHFEFNSDVPDNAPATIKSQYLQFPGGDKYVYASDKPAFQSAVLDINDSIWMSTGWYGDDIPLYVSTYDIVDHIRTYLETNYAIDSSFPLERPGSGDDQVEWFLSGTEGLPMDFAASFVMLARWFGVPCRYAAGYNSRFTSNENDGYGTYREIRMVNTDAWNEVYMPMMYGNPDEFTPFILTGATFAPPPGNGTTGDPLNILINGTYSTQQVTYRGFDVEITAELPSGMPGETITFHDHTEDVSLGSAVTNGIGRATFVLDVNTSLTAGAHFIEAQYTATQRNACAIILDDDVNVFMTSLNPTSINRATTNNTQVAAYIYDPENGNRVKNAILHPVVVQGSSAISGSIDPPYDAIKVDSNGAINEIVRISDYVSQGNYTFRVDFNGTYNIINPVTGFAEDITIPGGLIDDSSNDLSFEIIDDNQKIFDLYVDSGAVVEDTAFAKTRAQSIDFDIYLRQGSTDVSGGIVEIRDRTYDQFVLTTLVTAPDGTASTTYSLGSDYSHWVAGVHELYGVWTNGGGRLNQSYYLVVDEALTVRITNTPGPIVDRTGGTSELIVEGDLFDSDPGIMAPSRYGYIGVLLRDASTLADYTGSLTGDSTFFLSSTGVFSGTTARNHGVVATIPLGDYEVYTGFNGDWELPGGFTYNDASFNDVSTYELITITDPSNINVEFEIDGTPTQSSYFGSTAPSYGRWSSVNLYTRIWQAGSPQSGVGVNFYDENRGVQLGSTQYTNSSGEIDYGITLDASWTAGLNLVSVEYSTVKNYTQIYLNAPVTLVITTPPPTPATRGNSGTQMIIAGVLRDSSNSNPVKDAEIRLDVMDGAIDRTDEISTWNAPSTGRYTYTSQSDGTFQIYWRMPIHFQFSYDVSVTYTGYQQDNSPECQADYNNPAQSTSSATYPVQVNADSIISATFRPQPFVMGNPVNVSGYLTYDNGTALAGVSVTVYFYDSGMSELHSNTVTTDGSGYFEYYIASLTWPNTDTIFVEYFGTTGIDGDRAQAAYSP